MSIHFRIHSKRKFHGKLQATANISVGRLRQIVTTQDVSTTAYTRSAISRLASGEEDIKLCLCVKAVL